MRVGSHRKFEQCPLLINQLTYHRFDRPIAVVARPARVFHVHQDVLGASSFVLQDALNSRPEGSTEPIVLPGSYHERWFRIYFDWLYSGRLRITYSTKYDVWTEYLAWKAGYKLAGFLQDCTFKDALIDTIIEKMVEEDSYYDLDSFIYRNTSPGSPHRKLCVDIALSVWSDSYLGAGNPSRLLYTNEFLLDVIAELITKGRVSHVERGNMRDFFKDIDTCIYHEHTITKIPNSIIPCYKTK